MAQGIVSGFLNKVPGLALRERRFVFPCWNGLIGRQEFSEEGWFVSAAAALVIGPERIGHLLGLEL